MPTLTGSIERIIFRNEESGFVVARFRIQDVGGQRTYDDVTTVVGNIGSVAEGEFLHLTGAWQTHPIHGRNFRIERFEQQMPTTTAGIERYLASGIIKGIGPVTARRIVECFGERTLEVIESEPEKLKSVAGINSKRVELIVKGWQKQQQVRNLMMFLQAHNLPLGLAMRIHRQYGENAVAVIQSDPYQLAHDVYGIGFKTADAIAISLGMPRHSLSRFIAGLKYVLSEATNDGHVYLPRQELLERGTLLLEAQIEELEPALLELVRRKDAIIDGDDVYLAPFFIAERNTALRLKALRETPSALTLGRNTVDPAKAIVAAMRSLGVTLAGKQIEAAETALREKVSIITGGPGTGKTMSLHILIHALERTGVNYCLCAPTGRAAKRMTQATGRSASTIHRLLGYQPATNEFTYNSENQLPYDFVIVDEVSMLDALLFYNLLKAIPPEAHLLLVGDADQLPAVGPGNVLRDLLAAETIPTVTLTELFRQAQNSQIVVAAHQINRGEVPEPPVGDTDLYLVRINNPDRASTIVKELVSTRIPQHFGLDPIHDIQVISPMYQGPAGVATLNEELQLLLNPPGRGKSELKRAGRLFREGDKVMQIRNDYEKEVFNGDVGIVTAIDPNENMLAVNFDDGRDSYEIVYESSEIDELVLAYALSVHKAQGSEFPAVVMPLLTRHFMLLQRNLLYTALTRARQLCVLVYQPRALTIAVQTVTLDRRYTRLAERLRAARS
jgi:exodeoxyribonuclease V alpha subunit